MFHIRGINALLRCQCYFPSASNSCVRLICSTPNGILHRIKSAPSIQRFWVAGSVSAMNGILGHYVPQCSLASNGQTMSYSSVCAHGEKESIRRKVEEFAKKEGRRPRLLFTSLAREKHDRGLKIAASDLADLGFDIELGPNCVSPPAVVRLAVDSDAHIVGVSSVEPGSCKLVPELISLLNKAGHDCCVAVGGIVSQQDELELRKAGVAAIFKSGATSVEVARILLDILPRRESGPTY